MAAKKARAEKMPTRQDGWKNVFTQQGTGRDPRVATVYKRDTLLVREELNSIFTSNGLGRRIVTLPAQEGTREWVSIEGDKEGAILDVMADLRFQQVLKETWTWARLYGGALAVMLIDDGGKLEDPLNETAIKRIAGFRVYDRHQISWEQSDLYADPENEKFGTPERYKIAPYATNVAGANILQFKVHETRVLRIDGAPLPPTMRLANNGWGCSVLDAVFRELADVGGAFGATANILNDFIQAVLSVDGLSQLVSSDAGADQVNRRLDILAVSRSILRIMLVDKGEEYSKQASSVAGLADLLDRFCTLLSAVTGIPQTKLFGKAPQGLNATGDSDIRQWYDTIADEQGDILKALIERVAWIIANASEWPPGIKPFTGKFEDLRIAFNPLWQPSEGDLATARKTMSDADCAYIDRGVLLPEEVALSRFGGGKFSFETQINEALRVVPATAAELEAQQEAEAKKAQEQAMAIAAAKGAPKGNAQQ